MSNSELKSLFKQHGVLPVDHRPFAKYMLTGEVDEQSKFHERFVSGRYNRCVRAIMSRYIVVEYHPGTKTKERAA